MKAAQISEYGDASVITINEIAKPVAGEGQVVVAVHAASINPFDTTIRQGYMQEMIPLEFPVTLGGDIAGEIVEVGQGVEDFEVGDTVYGQANVVAGNSGAFAEFAATKADQIGRAPAGISILEAASLPLAGVSAVQALTEHLDLQEGQKIFIHGGGGGIGSMAIQIAKHIGAHVATTATGDRVEFVRSLGADEVIDYKTQDFTEVLADYDAVFDTVGGDDFARTLDVLRRGGTAVSMIAQPDEAKAAELGVTALMQSTGVTTDRLDKLTALVEDGVVKPQVDKTFPLAQVAEAFAAREGGAVKGKVVLQITA
ncbi:NADP-dependent oxidoreductase [Candidatus Saccharibacteria bacterium]|nr:NADP-dependent oxidoreductase [Candidatus Saccharibacteria bacterium]